MCIRDSNAAYQILTRHNAEGDKKADKERQRAEAEFLIFTTHRDSARDERFDIS